MKNFTLIHNEILEASQLSIQARLLHCILLKYCGQDEWCYPSQKTLAEQLSYRDPRHVRTILNELIQAGIIIKQRRGFNKTNTYKVAKEFIVDRNHSSPHLGSKFPLNQGMTAPPKNTYRKATDKKWKQLLRKRIEGLRLKTKSDNQSRPLE